MLLGSQTTVSALADCPQLCVQNSFVEQSLLSACFVVCLLFPELSVIALVITLSIQPKNKNNWTVEWAHKVYKIIWLYCLFSFHVLDTLNNRGLKIAPWGTIAVAAFAVGNSLCIQTQMVQSVCYFLHSCAIISVLNSCSAASAGWLKGCT